LAAERRGFGFDLLQVECAQLAPYGGDVLVEHDVTFDLFSQMARRDGTLSSWWTTGAGSGWRGGHHMLSPRGGDVGTGRGASGFRAEPERPGHHLLFIGPFRLFPNIAAYRFFTEHVWPLLRDKFSQNATYRGLRSRLPALLAHSGQPARAPCR
jgi:polysaccharide biosynthesis protein PslH